ncbi:polysaccharide biosynthesis tyrosine autokinase [Cohnella sp. CFH 77786]|uniref:CpsD/CapB family tyrosine-protein kinase n=1 Tax=Cohnella sp. CFH 77786 TaxID=2662265 RepID=UPI001C609990|nr:CpsD/CapB family tyrosine-protein kinase [Cohnella sp. CFH 77786]MBW5447128.1 polysaccharide biosynthesis tyrosine autokinase [Cohnella sp. CFH 77786]
MLRRNKRRSRSAGSGNRLITHANPTSPISKAYRTLRTNIQFTSIDNQNRVIMVTSSQAGDGKTTTISNLAVAYAQDGKKVLLIDCDLRKPSLHHLFHLSNRVGVSSVVSGQKEWNEAIHPTFVDRLSVLTSGPIPPNPSEIAGSNKMRDLIKELLNHFDYLFIDTPPLLVVPDGIIISSYCDGVVLVVRAEKTKQQTALKAKNSLDYVKSKILGVVINDKKRDPNNYYYEYYGAEE